MNKKRNTAFIKRILLCTMCAVLAVIVVISSLPNIPLQTSALTPSNPQNTTQTGYEDLVTFQKDKWGSIVSKVFGTTAYNTAPPAQTLVNNNTVKVQQGNAYFNWAVDIGVDAWDGQSATAADMLNKTATETIIYDSDIAINGANNNRLSASRASVNYTVYNVENASELRYAMNQAEAKKTAQNTKINIMADIDLNGANYMWTPNMYSGMNKWFYIEGNGYTIYNMKCYNTQTSIYGNGGFAGNFNASTAKLIIKNLNFSNCLSLSSNKIATAVVVGYISCRAYLENINVYDSFVYSNSSNTGTLIGRTESRYGDIFIRNCSSARCYVYGTDHTGGLTGCQHNFGTFQVKYNADFPATPEAWLNRSGTVYPEMIENCYSVDCELFSVGTEGDSGGFVSCGGKMILRNCFTNNIIYGKYQTGDFIGRIVTPQSGTNSLYDDAGKRTVEIYFESCYSSGTVEGIERIGGFVGLEDSGGIASYGVAIYKNCYTTAMVGMDYAGSRLGGFIGHENTASTQKTSVIIGYDKEGNPIYNTNAGSIYINCYVAGEVGNILTDTSTNQSGTNYLGGFLGLTGYYGAFGKETHTAGNGDTNGTYVNCYYDMQTTAMRERACGKADQFTTLTNEQGEQYIGESQIPGVIGTYTQKSEKKGVEGLADSVDMGDDNAWQNDTQDDMYPILKAFDDELQRSENFTTAYFGTTTTEAEQDLINKQLSDKADQVKKYARASVSTVLLSHWDTPMNMDTGTLGDENDWKLGLSQNKLTQVSYKDDDPNKWARDDDNQYWEITYKNLAAGSYEFKVQAGTSWAYNFGSNRFNGDNCVLVVPFDCDTKIKFDYSGQASESGNDTNYIIWAEYYNGDGTLHSTQELGKNENADSQSVWTVAGTFGELNTDTADKYWNPANKAYDLHYVGGGEYSAWFDLQAGTYSFKIAQNHDWAVSYGKSGGDADMSFTISEDCRVKISFEEENHITTVTTIPDEALTDVQTEAESIVFEGYSVIGPTAITGHEWLDSQAAVDDSRMTDDDGDGIYEKTFTIPRYTVTTTANADGTTTQTTVDNFGKIYGYKVIKNAVDIGQRTYYRIDTPAIDSTITEIQLTFKYNPETNETQVISSPQDLIDTDPQPDYYGVLGSMVLTGYNWGKDANDVEVEGAGKMAQDENGIWFITYKDVPAGQHSFKVAGNSTFSSGIDYGANGTSNNYELITNKTADITIKYDDTAKHITVTTTPDDAIFKDTYVVCGNENLTGENKVTNSNANTMHFDEVTGLYTMTYSNLLSDSKKNYAYKVVKYGQNNSNNYNAFTVYSDDPNDTNKYNFEITYDPNTKVTDYKLLTQDGNDVTEYVKEPYIEYYSVAGDELLTTYNWFDESVAVAAAEHGRMTYDGNGLWNVTFKDVKVEPTATSLAFKVVANGEWSSGIDYGKKSGENYVITLASETEVKCDVTITFDEASQEITVKTTPDCLATIDETQFSWYVCGVYTLVSSDTYKTEETVYDTVRDITAPFAFTTYETMEWYNDVSRNEDNNFYSYLGENNAEQGFSLDYTVEGKQITGKFNEQVISIEKEKVSNPDGSLKYYEYSCRNFVPGKQWIAVSVGDTNDEVKGRRFLRLIPTAYLEAGNDADIDVLQADSDIYNQNVYNLVTYRKNSMDGVTFELKGDTSRSFEQDTYFSSYNFALTAGYAITDKIGFGYYGNYSNQVIEKYDSNMLRANVLNATTAEADSKTFYVMTSAFAQTASYSDKDVQEGQKTNLSVDELVDQSLIGNSYDSRERDESGNLKNDSGTYAKTIVKIYKEVLNSDGKSYSYPKVFMDSTEASTSDYHTNYLKWTGQQPFDLDDEGTYVVTYYWSLADGRYLTDSKKVYINANKYNIEKTVDKSYIEKNEAANDNEIQYTVTYTNKNEGDFLICDVLPFDKDVRYDFSKESHISNSTMQDSSFVLKSFSAVSKTIESDDPDSPAKIQNLKAYYSTDNTVRSYISDADGAPAGDAATKVDLNDGKWRSMPDLLEDVSPTALVVAGEQANQGTTTVTITYTVEVQNAEFKDYYTNNAFFSANNDTAITEQLAIPPMITGYSDVATTAVIGRGLSGYVWLDFDLNGKFGDNEPPIEGVTVELLKRNAAGEYNQTGFSDVTDSDGYYSFDDIYPAGDDYRVYFSAPGSDSTQSGDVTIKYSTGDKTVNFDELTLSRRLSKYQVNSKDESRNIAEQDGDATANRSYFIDEEMPSADGDDGIFANNNRMRWKEGSVSNYYFQREFQNLGLRNIVEDKECSLTVKKLEGGTDIPLEGVEFKLEYLPEDKEDYVPVTYKLSTDENGNAVYEFTTEAGENVQEAKAVKTNAQGLIRFTKLPSSAQYRLSEVKTLDGYNLLPTALEFTLPYYIDGSDISPDGYVTGADANPYQGVYYYDVTYTVTNSKIPTMPLTGVENNILPIIIASVLLATCFAMLVIYKAKNRKIMSFNR